MNSETEEGKAQQRRKNKEKKDMIIQSDDKQTQRNQIKMRQKTVLAETEGNK